jgi:ABC-2 type transport system permease protein
MRPYVSLFRMRLISGMQYRAAAWAGVATQFFWGFMLLMIYRAFYRSGGEALPMAWEQLCAYVWLHQAFLAILALWIQDDELLSGIRDGLVAYELCRPVDLYSFWFARLTATRLSKAALRCVPVIVFALLIPPPYRLILPPDAGALVLFLISMSLALALVIAVSMFVYILTFITLTPQGSRLIVALFGDFFAGGIVPIPMMPDWMQRAISFFPFRYTQDLPLRLYSGSISGGEAVSQIAVQLLWTAGLIAAGKFAFDRVTRRIVVQGG